MKTLAAKRSKTEEPAEKRSAGRVVVIQQETEMSTPPVAGGRAFPGAAEGLPDHLRSGIEALSGFAMDQVTVHRNSDLPAQVGAHAYTQGSQIHLGPRQEHHLPHEAWHVVQQAQGRVRATRQLKGKGSVSDDQGLEREADVMGRRALLAGPAAAARRSTIRLRPVGHPAAGLLQLQKIVAQPPRGRGGKWLVVVDDEYELKDGEEWATDREILGFRGRDKRILDKQEELRSAARKQVRDRRRAAVPRNQKPGARRGKHVHFPVVVQSRGGPADLVYRGMSVNNVKNFIRGGDPIFKAQKPDGAASVVDHIVDDSRESPYLSFEAGGLGISAGKYGHKPVDDGNRPLHVEQDADGFLKQEKSYTKKAMDSHKGKRIGYVGGIPQAKDDLDLSTREVAEKGIPATGPDASEDQKEKRKKAVNLAVADKEVLVKPGAGIGGEDVPFVAKVKVVDEAYFLKNVIHQRPKMALGFYKSSKGQPVYCKLQVVKGTYTFQVPKQLLRNEDDSEDEMSEIEDMDLTGFK